jgi:uncharacterized protein YerC
MAQVSDLFFCFPSIRDRRRECLLIRVKLACGPTFSNAFDRQRAKIPELKEVTLRGLRCNAVIRLRREGLSVGQIGDITGMSLATIERYRRFADCKTSGQAALLQIKRNRTLAEQKL